MKGREADRGENRNVVKRESRKGLTGGGEGTDSVGLPLFKMKYKEKFPRVTKNCFGRKLFINMLFSQ